MTFSSYSESNRESDLRLNLESIQGENRSETFVRKRSQDTREHQEARADWWKAVRSSCPSAASAAPSAGPRPAGRPMGQQAEG